MYLRHAEPTLSYPRGMLRVSLQQPDRSPSAGGRTAQAPPAVWPAKMTEDAVGECIAPHTEDAESRCAHRVLAL
jgi:hypothetical protein